MESTGTGGGFKLFCGGVGAQYPDLTNASRAIKPSEVDSCKKAGVNDILEVKVGYDGIPCSNSKKAPLYKLTRKDLFLALAKQVPDPANNQNLVAEPVQDLERDQQGPAGREDRGAGPAADLRHARRVRRAGDGGGLLELRLDQGAEGRGRGPVQAGVRFDP